MHILFVHICSNTLSCQEVDSFAEKNLLFTLKYSSVLLVFHYKPSVEQTGLCDSYKHMPKGPLKQTVYCSCALGEQTSM